MTDHAPETPYHIPALLPEAIEALNIRPDGIYADVTFGGGGHSRAIMERLGEKGHLYGFDQDADAAANIIHDDRFTFVHSNFRYLPNFLRYYGAGKIDGILADLGVSFHHFDDPSRGFSFRADAPLDMRMNKKASLTAADILNNCTLQQIRDIISTGSDLNANLYANAIIKARAKGDITTTGELAEAVKPIINPRNEKKELAQLFQALRMRVNREYDVLVELLQNAGKVLRPGGRLAIITYHSLEDRLVKALMRSGNVKGKIEQDFFGNVHTPWKLITKSPITPSAEEVERNPRSRSAKLRVAELLKND